MLLKNHLSTRSCVDFHFLKLNIKFTVEALEKKIKMEMINILVQKQQLANEE